MTSLQTLDKAHAIASRSEVIFCSFGDMLRVPGSATDLLRLKAQGADVRMVYSPLDCLRIAQAHPDRQVVFLAVGFETTAPANAMTIYQAEQLGLRNFEAGRAEVENQYSRAVNRNGNLPAHEIMWRVFEVCDQQWRGVGTLPESGYRLCHAFRHYDAAQRFAVEEIATQESSVCISGQILTGLKKPQECPAFGRTCTPQQPLGATMVSAEGACAAYYNYGRHLGAR